MKTQPVNTEEKEHNKTKLNDFTENPIVVGIGASAGGLTALEGFFKNMPANSEFIFVVIQHLYPGHKSMLPDILQRSTTMKVVQVEDKMPLKPNTIYVIPPGCNIDVTDNHLELTKQQEPRGIPLPIDYFFRSLKDWNHERAIGIILSGTGSDGTLGLREIKAESGMIMVQAPDTAGHKGMPDSAIRTGLVDYILPPEEMPQKLIDFVNKSINQPVDERFDGNTNKQLIQEIYKVLKNRTKHDFGEYKFSTVFRRIERRMMLNSSSELKHYVDLLKSEEEEVDALFNELLIGVTSFFRNKEAFIKLEELISDMVEQREDEPLRVWIAGCSTGEEAYSIAMLIDKQLNLQNKNLQVQLFASDIDERALEFARAGKYPPNIEADVPGEMLAKYFSKEDKYYRIKKKIRDMVVFANHSIVKDPPYSKLDLLSCRNLLIYLQNSIQNKVMQIFYYALKKDGYLLLGSSESLGKFREIFSIIDFKWKIFKKNNSMRREGFTWDYQLNETDSISRETTKKKVENISVKDLAEKAVLQKFSNPLLIINRDGIILYSVGSVNKYLEFPAGEPSHNIINAATAELKVSLSNGIRKLKLRKNGKQDLCYDNIKFNRNGNEEVIRLVISPVSSPASMKNLFMVYIEPYKIVHLRSSEMNTFSDDGDAKDEYIQNVEQELKETRNYLQSVVEELESSNEELKSVNEEAQSSNEELQSSNEELESSKEELQSLNEELETSNNELQRKLMELSHANNDINNFLTSTKIGTIFLNRAMRIQRFTPAVTSIIELLESDIGRPLENFVNKLKYGQLVEDAREVLETLVPKENEVNLAGNQYFWMRILPYRTLEDKIEGVVITFTDITEYKKMQELSELSQYKYKMLFQNMTSGVLVQELIYENGEPVDTRMIEANDAYFNHTGVEKEKIIGKRMTEIFPKFNKALFRNFINVVNTGKPYIATEYSEQFNRFYRISAYKFSGDKRFVVIFDNVTSEVEAEEKVKQSEKKFRSLFTFISVGLSINKIVKIESGKRAVFVDINPSMEKLIGEKNNKVTDRPLGDFFPFSEDNLEHQIIDRISEGQNFLSEMFVPSRQKYYHLSAFPIYTDQFVLLLQDVTEEKKFLLAQQHLAAIVESSQDAIYSVSLDAKILTWNKGAERFYGYTASEIIGKDVSVLSADYNLQQHLGLIDKVAKGGKVTSLEFNQVAKDGRKFPVFLTKSPIFNRKGEVISISDIVKDISILKEREEQLIREKKKAEKAGNLKTAFLQNVSHEIRTPMNSIVGFTDILKDRIKDDKTRGFAITVEQSAKQLIRLIDDILDISRIEADELPIEKGAFDLDKLLHQMKQQFEGVKKTIKKESIKLKLVLPKTRNRNQLITDRYRLEQILSNLLSNALKYTEAGEVTFGYERSNGQLRFFVQDTGIGIKEENLNKIFTRFERASHKNDNVLRGSGLGLAISKGLVKRLGGEIEAKSTLGKGSTFYFTLPDERVDTAEIEDRYADIIDTDIPDLKNKKILIAEDDEFSAQMMQLIFEPTNADLIMAIDGEEAVTLFHKEKPDLVFLDIRLPKLTGFEVLREIRKVNAEIKVVAQTAYAMPEDKRKSLKAGFDEHLVKPLSLKTVYGLLNKLKNIN